MTDQKFFFSYAREDSEFVLKLARELRAVGASLWLDQLDIIGGQRWDQAVEEGLVTCKGMIACLSPKSLTSNNVMDEVSYALEEGKLVVPIRLRPCVIPFRLRRLQHVDFAEADYTVAFLQLLKALGVEPVTQSVPAIAAWATETERGGTAVQQARGREERNEDTPSTPPLGVAKSTKLSPAVLIGVGAVLAFLILAGYQGFRRSGAQPPRPSPSVEQHDVKPSSAAEPTTHPPTGEAEKRPDPASNARERVGQAGSKVDQPGQNPRREIVSNTQPTATAAMEPISPTSDLGSKRSSTDSLVPGLWSGTLSFAGVVSPISIEFCDDASLRLKSRLGDRAFGEWRTPSTSAVRIDARHRDLGSFTCELSATGSSLNGPCEAAGRPAGVIGLSTRRELPKTSPSAGIVLNGTLCEQRSFAETPTTGAESEEQTRRRWDAFLRSIRN